jgi:hypothetical protein
VPVVIAPVIVEAPRRPIPRGAATQVHLTIASVAQLGERLEVVATGGTLLGEPRRTEHGLDLAVTPREGARAAILAVRSREAELGRVELAVTDAPEPEPPRGAAPPGRWLAIDLGVQFGVLVPPGGGTSAAAITAPGETLATGPLVGARVGFFPTPRVGIEGEVAIDAPGYRRGGGTLLLSVRAHLAARVLEDGRRGLRLLGGAGVLEGAGAVHYGAALTLETRRDIWVRFQALHAITTARDAGYAHCLELQLGVVTRLGRRDRRW